MPCTTQLIAKSLANIKMWATIIKKNTNNFVDKASLGRRGMELELKKTGPLLCGRCRDLA